MIGYHFVKLASRLVCAAPDFINRALGNFLGFAAVKFAPSWRMKMAEANIRECIGVEEKEARLIAEQSLHRFGRMAIEFLRFPLMAPDNLSDFVEIEGLDNLREAVAAGRGVIIATGHFGNWELLGAVISMLGYKMLSIARRQNNSDMDRFINEYRERVGQDIAYNKGRSGLLAISRALKERRFLGILYDQDTNDDGVNLKLFNRDSVIPLGAAVLSRLHGTPIIPIFMHNRSDGKSLVKVHSPLFPECTEDKHGDYTETTEKLVAILESEIRSDPAMWFWVHDRWKDGRQRFKNN